MDEWPTATVCESGDDMSAEDKKTAEELGMKDDVSEDDVLDGRNHNLHVDEEEEGSDEEHQYVKDYNERFNDDYDGKAKIVKSYSPRIKQDEEYDPTGINDSKEYLEN